MIDTVIDPPRPSRAWEDPLSETVIDLPVSRFVSVAVWPGKRSICLTWLYSLSKNMLLISGPSTWTSTGNPHAASVWSASGGMGSCFGLTAVAAGPTASAGAIVERRRTPRRMATPFCPFWLPGPGGLVERSVPARHAGSHPPARPTWVARREHFLTVRQGSAWPATD